MKTHARLARVLGAATIALGAQWVPAHAQTNTSSGKIRGTWATWTAIPVPPSCGPTTFTFATTFAVITIADATDAYTGAIEIWASGSSPCENTAVAATGPITATCTGGTGIHRQGGSAAPTSNVGCSLGGTWDRTGDVHMELTGSIAIDGHVFPIGSQFPMRVDMSYVPDPFTPGGVVDGTFEHVTL